MNQNNNNVEYFWKNLPWETVKMRIQGSLWSSLTWDNSKAALCCMDLLISSNSITQGLGQRQTEPAGPTSHTPSQHPKWLGLAVWYKISRWSIPHWRFRRINLKPVFNGYLFASRLTTSHGELPHSGTSLPVGKCFPFWCKSACCSLHLTSPLPDKKMHNVDSG